MHNKPLFWEQGTFLQPQHLQLSNAHASALVEPLRTLMYPYFWGIRELRLREEALAIGVFEIAQLDVLLQDGAHLQLPGNTVLLSRSFRDVWDNPDAPLPVWLSLAPENGNGNNVVSTDDPSEVPETIRFVVSQNPESVPDLQGQGPAAQLRLLRYNARLLFGSESERSGESLRIPLATLEREGEKVTVSHQFAPPCVDIKAIPVLREMFKDVRDTVLSRARQLEEYKIVAGEGAAAVATSAQSIALFTILGVLARNAPTLEHLFEAPTLHPWAAYGALRQLVGELSIFSSELSPLGETIQGRRVLPAYDHEALASCFAAAKSIITRLVDTLVVGPAYMLRLEPEGDLLTTTIPTSAMGSEFRAWLLLRSAHPAADMVGRLRLSMKCGAMTDIRALVSNALPGIRLLHADTPPAGLPRRADTTYYAVDQDDSLWRDVQNQGKLTLFFPNAPDDLLVHLAIIAR